MVEVVAVTVDVVDVDVEVDVVAAAVVVVLPKAVVVVALALVVVVAAALVVVAAAAVLVVVEAPVVVVVFNDNTVWVGSTRAITVLSFILEYCVKPPWVSGHDTSMTTALLLVPLVIVQLRVNVVVRLATTTFAPAGPMVSVPVVIASNAAKFL